MALSAIRSIPFFSTSPTLTADCAQSTLQTMDIVGTVIKPFKCVALAAMLVPPLLSCLGGMKDRATALLAGPVATFVAAHSEYRTVEEAQPVAQWECGVRQDAQIGGFRHRFFVENNEVVTVRWWNHNGVEAVAWQKDGHVACNAEDATVRFRPAQKPLSEYKIMKTNRTQAGVRAKVVMTSLSSDESVEILAFVADTIIRREGFNHLTLYCTDQAMLADMSADYAAREPSARSCILGSMTSGQPFAK